MSSNEERAHSDPRLAKIDKLILTTLKQQHIASPMLIASKIKRDRRYVANRLRYLTDLGLVEKIARGLYRLKQQASEVGE